MPTLSILLESLPSDGPGWRAAWGTSLRWAGYGTKVKRASDEGSANAREGLALLEGHARAISHAFLQPELGLGLGVYGLGVSGKARPPFAAHESNSFSPLLALRMSVDGRLAARFAVRISAYLLYAPIKTSLRIADTEVARAGGTMLGVSFEVRAWL